MYWSFRFVNLYNLYMRIQLTNLGGVSNQINFWSKLVLQNLVVHHLLTNFPAMYETRRFITILHGVN
jgi:hypothetical protein